MKMRMLSRRILVTISVSAILAIGIVCGVGAYWRFTHSLTRGIDDDEAMKETIRQVIPRGTAIAEAQRVMEREGFSCRIYRNKSFLNKGKPVDGKDFLHCERWDGSPFGLVKRHWQVILVIDDDVVVDVVASSSLVGL